MSTMPVPSSSHGCRVSPWRPLWGPPRWSGRAVLCALLAVAACALAGCNSDQNEDGGSGNMFGIFGSRKAARTETVVSPALAAALTRADAAPAEVPPAPVTDFGRCEGRHLEGGKREGLLLDPNAFDYHEVSGIPGQPAIAVLDVRDHGPSVEIWELGAGTPVRFERQRTVQFDPGQAGWTAFSTVGVACLPVHQVLIGLDYSEPQGRTALFVYDVASNGARKLANIEPDPNSFLRGNFFATLPVAPDAVLVLFHTDQERLGPERYVNKYDHLMLFSTRYPKGLEILKLGVDDGNVRRWDMVGSTLWLDTLDARNPAQPVKFTWSLDLSKVL